MTESNRYKICFIDYDCKPGRDGASGLGWSFVREMSRTQPVWVLTHEDGRPAIDAYLRDQHTGHPIFPVYVKLPRGLAWMRTSCAAMFVLHEYLWQFAAAKALKRLHARVGLDLTQHVSPGRGWMPSAGATLVDRGVGFIFGPVGGDEVLPKNLRDRPSLRGRINDTMRRIGRSLCRRDPLLARSLRKADLLVAALPSTRDELATYGSPNVEVDCAAVCSSPEVLRDAAFARTTRAAGAPFTFASCGGLGDVRGVDLALRAFAKADIPNSRYVHAGDGPMRPALEHLARDLNVGGRVILLGDLPHGDCVNAIALADAAVHTAVRDGQGVLADALVVGTPVIALNHLTPAQLVTADCGHLIPLDDGTTPQQIIDALAATMTAWHADPAMLAAKSEAAKARGRTFLPDARGVALRQMQERAMRLVRQRTDARLAVPAALARPTHEAA